MGMSQLHFVLAVPKHFKMPIQAGSMLRGAFGHALRALSCKTGAQQCAGCPQVQKCAYPEVFERKAQALAEERVSLPSPYVIQPGESQPLPVGAQHYEYRFSMRLFGEGVQHYLPDIVKAWDQALTTGLGTPKVSMQLLKVSQEQPRQVIWSHDSPTHAPLLMATPSFILPPLEPQPKIEVQFKRPLRLKYQNKIVKTSQLNLTLLMRAAIRRNQLILSELIPQFQTHPICAPINCSDLQDVKIQQDLKWQDWHRYSNRQQQSMTLGGIVGRIVIPAKTLTPQQWQHLQLATYTHIGSHTVFGMGEITLKRPTLSLNTRLTK